MAVNELRDRRGAGFYERRREPVSREVPQELPEYLFAAALVSLAVIGLLLAIVWLN